MPSPPLSIVQSLSPRIAVLSTDDVVQSCEANGCRGLDELLRPWEGGTERVSILSTTLTPTIHPTFPLRFVPYDSVYKNPTTSSPQPDIVVDLIGGFVGAKKPEDEQHYPLTRSLLLSSRPLAAHETFNHPVGVVFAVSTANPEPLNALNELQLRTVGTTAQIPPWMDGGTVLRFYVVVHDISQMGDDLTSAEDLLTSVKKIYGPHSTLLVINSQVDHRSPPSSPDVSTHPSMPLPRPFAPDAANPSALSQVYASALSSLTLSPMAAASASLGGAAISDTPAEPSRPVRRKLYAAKMTADDTQRLAALVRELVVQSLVPWMEARIREWNEVYHANRRGITGRLFGAGRKFFGSRPSSPAPGTTATGYNVVKGYYPTTAVVALSRRLADFAFMLRDYKFAGGVYDSLRKDFAQDRAIRYAAAATEMYGLCLLLGHTFFLPSSPPTPVSAPFTNLQHTEIISWLEQAVTAYHQQAPASQIQLDALRITVLYYEAWKAIGEWRGVGQALVKSAGEADEVPSAVMIEEAAAADVKGGKSSRGRRRRAFHLVLAARRYETAGLKTYSRRCLERASQLYRDSPWTSAQDRIEYSLGRQAYTLGESDVAVEHFLRLLRREDTGVPGSQAGPLQDMALAYEQLSAHPELLASSSDKLQLPTPVFDVGKTRIAPLPEASTSGSSRTAWIELEAQALQTWDRKGKKPMNLLPEEKRFVVGVGEAFRVELAATNPLNAPVVLSDLTITFDPQDAVQVETIEDLPLEPYETRIVSLTVTPLVSTHLRLSQATFLFHRFFPCVQILERNGPRLHSTKAQRITPTYAKDPTLTVEVVPTRATVSVELIDLPETAFVGEEVQSTLRISNRGKVAVEDLQMIWNHFGIIRRKDEAGIRGDAQPILNTIQTNCATALSAEAIAPDSTIDIPIIFSAPTAGFLNLLGLIIFVTTSTESAAAASISHYIDVKPVLGLRHQIRPVGQDATSSLVILEITNQSSETVTIDGISGISASWKANQQDSEDGLLPNQTLRRVLPLRLVRSPGVDLQQKSLVQALGMLIAGSPIDEVKSEIAKISVWEQSHQPDLAPRRAFRLAQLYTAFPTIPHQSLSAIFPLFDPLDLDIQISYLIRSSPVSEVAQRTGRVIACGLRPAPAFSVVDGLRREVENAILGGSKSTRTMYEETTRLKGVLMDSVLDGLLATEEDPVHIGVRIEGATNGRVVHDFKQGATKRRVTFQVKNRSPLLPVRYIINLPVPSTSSTDTIYSPRYVGDLSVRGQISPCEIAHVETSIWLHEPCLLDLGGWEVLVEAGNPGDGEWVARQSWRRTGKEKVVEVCAGP
ncbi:hypothetical protein IAU60_000858 [Kwoniella sp. DSM 27419]